MENKIIKFLIVFIFSMIVFSCGSSQKDEGSIYFANLDILTNKIENQPEKIKALQAREQKKYESTGDRKYQIGSKYIEFLYVANDSRLKNKENIVNDIPVVYELLMLNNNEYDYITIVGDFSLAHKFEHQSPKLAMQFLDDAIKLEESGEKYFLPHLYHVKGRFLFNDQNYTQALIYFNKSLKIFSKSRDNLIYIASMHNNFALTYEKMGRIDLAIQEAKEAVRILETERNLKPEETAFLISVKGNMGFYYYKKKNFSEAEKLLLQEFEFYKKDKKSHHESITNLTELFDLYNETDQNNKMKEIADYGKSIESETAGISDKILINEMIQSYYLKMNDTEMVKKICRKLITLHNKHEEESNKKLTYISDVLNNFMIKS
ncbi:Tetratricopeptide repeat-containing protein, partial [Chryseobacterium oleae]